VAATASSAMHHNGQPQAGHAELVASEKGRSRSPRTLCGCSTLVLVLSIIIAILAAAVVGLAAATGVVVNNYNSADSDLQDLRASYTSLEAVAAEATGSPASDGNGSGTGSESTTTTTSLFTSTTASQTSAATSSTPSATSTDLSALTRDCSNQERGPDNSSYQSPSRITRQRFDVYCKVDAGGTLLYTVTVANFELCMDACASWNHWADRNNHTQCDAAAFIPKWVDLDQQARDNARGSCYLKRDTPSQQEDYNDDVHSGVLVVDDEDE
jgi:type II secretory pathway pseudopilin PulG